MVMCVCCWCGCTRNAPRPAQHTRSSRAPPYTFQPSMLLLYGPAVGFTDTATYVLSVQHTHTHIHPASPAMALLFDRRNVHNDLDFGFSCVLWLPFVAVRLRRHRHVAAAVVCSRVPFMLPFFLEGRTAWQGEHTLDGGSGWSGARASYNATPRAVRCRELRRRA